MAEYGDPALRISVRCGSGESRQYLQHIDQLLDAVGADDAQLVEGCAIDFFRSRQRAGMRLHCPAASVAHADLDQYDRLAGLGGFGGSGTELVTIADAFNVTGDDAHSGISHEVIAEITELQIAFIAGAEKVADADLLSVGERGDGGADCATLAHEANRARGEAYLVEHLADGGDDLVVEVCHADRIRADEADAFFESLDSQFVLQLHSLGPGLSETGGQNQGCLHLAWPAFIQQLDDTRRRQGDDQQIHFAFDLRDRLVAAYAADLVQPLPHVGDVVVFAERLDVAAENGDLGVLIISHPHAPGPNRQLGHAVDPFRQIHLEALHREPIGAVAHARVQLIL